SQEPPQWQQETLKPEAPAAQEPQSAEKTAKASDASVKTRRMFAVKLLPVNAPPPVASPDTQESQEIPEQDYTPIAEKTLFVDVAPIVVGLTPGIIGKIFGGGELGGLGFGIGVQYERRLLEEFSLMGRFDYIGVTTMTLFNEKQIYHMSNISFEMHARIYQSVHHGSAFFFGGYVGAGFAEIDSDVDVEFDYYSKSKYKATASRLYLKLGPSFGYRNMFGKSGKFSYETSFGYRIAFMGEPLAKQVTDVAADNDLYFTENLWRNVENFIIIGGPRLVVAFGYSF
ncbi:MAG: hypothetical protein LBH93_07875, partial [Chitinispirillales bacterium]|nr:hypothetical protein [Chitinispirillales bacterium]